MVGVLELVAFFEEPQLMIIAVKATMRIKDMRFIEKYFKGRRKTRAIELNAYVM